MSKALGFLWRPTPPVTTVQLLDDTVWPERVAAVAALWSVPAALKVVVTRGRVGDYHPHRGFLSVVSADSFHSGPFSVAWGTFDLVRDTNYFRDATAFFNTSFPLWTDTPVVLDFYLAHEIGHLLGLDQIYDLDPASASCMNVGAQASTPSADDYALLERLYG